MKKRTVAQNYEDSKVYTKMIDAIKAGTYAEEDFKKFVRKEEASGRIESLLSAFHAVIAEQIAAGYMGDKDEVVSGRINRYYDLIFETSSTAKVMRLDADNEAAERWEKKGLSWYVHEIPAPATYPKL